MAQLGEIGFWIDTAVRVAAIVVLLNMPKVRGKVLLLTFLLLVTSVGLGNEFLFRYYFPRHPELSVQQFGSYQAMLSIPALFDYPILLAFVIAYRKLVLTGASSAGARAISFAVSWRALALLGVGATICAWQVYEVNNTSHFTFWIVGFVPIPVIVLGVLLVLGGVISLFVEKDVH